ncbi:MAG: hypothetical protein ACLUI3_09200 [Christensenellales bacterium]
MDFRSAPAIADAVKRVASRARGAIRSAASRMRGRNAITGSAAAGRL